MALFWARVENPCYRNMEVFFTIFLFIAITGLTAVLFGGWVIVVVFRTLFRVLGTLLGVPTNPRRYARMNAVSSRTCLNPRCLQTNPGDALFCKRCGRPFPNPQHVAVRRAAMW